jgi:hypothetical protein
MDKLQITMKRHMTATLPSIIVKKKKKDAASSRADALRNFLADNFT